MKHSLIKTGAATTFGPFEWTPDPAKLYLPANDIAVVVFIQRADTKEVYQTSLLLDLNDPSVVTGLENVSSDDVTLFPNPANKEFTVQLPSVTTKAVELQVMDQVGRAVATARIKEGQRNSTISTHDLPSGMYIIQLGSSDQVIRKKIIVVHGE